MGQLQGQVIVLSMVYTLTGRSKLATGTVQNVLPHGPLHALLHGHFRLWLMRLQCWRGSGGEGQGPGPGGLLACLLGVGQRECCYALGRWQLGMQHAHTWPLTGTELQVADISN